MESQGFRRCPQNETTTHHHHCRHCPLRPLRRHCHHCPLHYPHTDHFLKPFLTPLPQTHHHPSHSPHHHQQPISSHAQISQELEHIELAGEEEDDDEPVFVLTDEWREFFAKSEARRKLEKKQGKKGKK